MWSSGDRAHGNRAGRISLDDAIGWADNITGIARASLALGSAIVDSLITTTLGRGSADLDEIPG